MNIIRTCAVAIIYRVVANSTLAQIRNTIKIFMTLKVFLKGNSISIIRSTMSFICPLYNK